MEAKREYFMQLHLSTSCYEPRKFCVPREDLFPIPFKYIDVVRHMQKNVDILQEHKIVDYWNVDGARQLSATWIGFTRFTVLKKPPPAGHMWARERVTKIQTTSRPDDVWSEVRSNMFKGHQREAKQRWQRDEPKLDAARRLKGIYYIAPDQEFDTVISNFKRKLETQMESAMPCTAQKKLRKRRH